MERNTESQPQLQPVEASFSQRRAKTHGRMERIPETETIPAVGTDGPRGAADVAVRGS